MAISKIFKLKPTIGRRVIVKADTHSLSVYLKNKVIATHLRSYKRKERIELPAHREAARKQQRRFWQSQYVGAFISLGEEARTYLERRQICSASRKNS